MHLLWFNKKLIIYLNVPTYFSKDFKNHYSDDKKMLQCLSDNIQGISIKHEGFL